MKKILLSLAICLATTSAALAADACAKPEGCATTETCGSPNCCAHCGHRGCCEKYCKIVCEMKEVKKYVFEVKCSEFCPVNPCCGRDGCCCDQSSGQGVAGDTCCHSCKACDACAGEQAKADRMKTPTCGKNRVKKTLVKKEVTCKVPVYKCVVTYACASCGAGVPSGSATPAPAAAPAKPVAPPPPAPMPKTTQDAPLPPSLTASRDI